MTEKVAIVGCGTVGVGWASLFAAHGWHVTVFDERHSRVEEALSLLSSIRALGESKVIPVAGGSTLEAAVSSSDFIQECVPDDLTIKRDVLARIARVAMPCCPIASSTSTYCATDLQQGLQGAERVLVGHPFHPVTLIPLVELSPGKHTTRFFVQRADEVYRQLGKVVIHLKREAAGHIVNRLQAALFREAIHLVTSGVATTEDIDRGIAYGPALRWTLGGTFMTWHLSAGQGGIAEYLKRLGPSFELMWSQLGTAKIDSATCDLIARQVEAECKEVPIERLEQDRDRLLELMSQSLRASGRLV